MSKVQKIYLSTATVTRDDITTIDGMGKVLHDVVIDIFKGVIRTIITPTKDRSYAFHECADLLAKALTNDVLTVDDTILLMDYIVERTKEVQIAKGSDD